MNKTILGILITILFIRFVTYPSPLSSDWEPESKIGLTLNVLDKPEYTDTQTIIRSGIWQVKKKGYIDIIPGSRVKFVGAVEPKVVLGKVVQLKMIDPSVSAMGKAGKFSLNNMVVQINLLRSEWTSTLRSSLPEPMSSLAAGILLGVKDQMPYDFYQDLIRTGTVHIVAASGYNVTIVAFTLIKIISIFANRAVAIGMAVAGIVIYVVMAGAGASVLRAGIMGSLSLVAYYYGRPAEAKRLLWVTGYVMLLVNPILIFDVGFQLSFAATFGLLYSPSWLKSLGSLANEYLVPTLVAAISTAPIIFWHFGRVSWMSPLSNLLVLPTVPIIMELSAIVIVLGSVSLPLARVVSWLVYPILWYIVFVIRHL